MPAPPIDNPTPFTCRNCGAGLQERAKFCPHCGARLEARPARNLGWFVGIVALGLVTLAFGGIGACATSFVVGVLNPTPQSPFSTNDIWITAPFYLLSFGGLWLCGRALLRRFRE